MHDERPVDTGWPVYYHAEIVSAPRPYIAEADDQFEGGEPNGAESYRCVDAGLHGKLHSGASLVVAHEFERVWCYHARHTQQRSVAVTIGP